MNTNSKSVSIATRETVTQSLKSTLAEANPVNSFGIHTANVVNLARRESVQVAFAA